MKRTATTLLLSLLAAILVLPVLAQPVRNGVDVVWARDVEGATMTLDGMLDEAAWQEAEMIVIQRGQFYGPGGGWQDFTGFAINEPTDPVDATIYFLRDGNTLWIGVDAADKSIGGTQDFFQHDGLVMSILNKNNRETAYDGAHWFNGGNTDEFFFSWLNRSSAGGPLIPDSVGIGAILFGNQAVDGVPVDDIWDGATVVDGVSNDDTNGTGQPTEDVGYTMEVIIDLEKLGFDMTDADGDHLALTAGIYDLDYSWPADPNLRFRSRAWWQNPWGGDMPFGAGFVYGSPDVTISSGDVPEITEPDLRIPKTGDATVITLDGQLDEAIWSNVEPQVTLQYQMSPEMLDALPGYGPYYTHWFRPGFVSEEESPPVVDPSIGAIRMFYQGNTLYVGLDSDDQAISGQVGVLDRNDGIRFTIRQLEDAEGGPALNPLVGFRVVVDSTGSAVLLDAALGGDGNPAPGVQAAVFLNDGSTAGDPSDVDAGYQIELAIDLEEVFGYPADLDGEVIRIGAVYFDGDDLDPAENGYGTRTWWLTENPGDFGGPAAMAYFDASLVSANEDAAEVPREITLYGNYPNPFNPATTLLYALPQTGEVRVHVFDVLGRQVALMTPGVQHAGTNTYTFEAPGLASGLYLYRVDLLQAGNVRASARGQMILLK